MTSAGAWNCKPTPTRPSPARSASFHHQAGRGPATSSPQAWRRQGHRRRETRARPDPAQAPLPLGTRPHYTRRAVHPGRTQRHLGARRPHRADASTQIRHLAATDPTAAADAAWAAADTLHAAAAAMRSRVLRQAADSYDRAARAPYGRIPSPTPAGNSLRRAARLLSAAASVSDDAALAQITLVTRLITLMETIADLREAQRHAAQAATARHAAERLHVARAARARPQEQRGRARAAADRIGRDFPFSIGAVVAKASASPGDRGTTSASPRPSHGPGSPRPCGPTR